MYNTEDHNRKSICFVAIIPDTITMDILPNREKIFNKNMAIIALVVALIFVAGVAVCAWTKGREFGGDMRRDRAGSFNRTGAPMRGAYPHGGAMPDRSADGNRPGRGYEDGNAGVLDTQGVSNITAGSSSSAGATMPPTPSAPQ